MAHRGKLCPVDVEKGGSMEPYQGRLPPATRSSFVDTSRNAHNCRLLQGSANTLEEFATPVHMLQGAWKMSWMVVRDDNRRPETSPDMRMVALFDIAASKTAGRKGSAPSATSARGAA